MLGVLISFLSGMFCGAGIYFVLELIICALSERKDDEQCVSN